MEKRFKGTLNDLCRYYSDMFDQEDKRCKKTCNPEAIHTPIDGASVTERFKMEITEDHSLTIPITITPTKIRLDNVTIEISFNAVDNAKSTDTKSKIIKIN